MSEAIANPVADVLNELSSQAGGTQYTFVGTTDHAVSCLNYGSGTVAAAQARTLSAAETSRAGQALMQARMLVNPSAGVLGVATGKSSDRAGEATVIFYVDSRSKASLPATVSGVRTEVLPATAQAVAMGSAPHSWLQAGALPGLPAATLSLAIAVKQQWARSLMRKNSAFFGVGVAQSFDNPREAALVIYVDRRHVPAQLPATIGGLRTRYVIMDRLHVTRSWMAPTPTRSRCMAHGAERPQGLDLLGARRLHLLKLFY
jgi:hypothetical protein